MRKITWEYLAGFFDGEGTIYFNPKLKKGVHTFVGVYQAEHQASVLYLIRKFLKENNIESKIYIRKEKRKGQNYRGVSLEIGHKIEVLNFLKKIEPYLIVKRNKCAKIIKEIEEYLKNGGKHCLTTFEKAEIKKLWDSGETAKNISRKLGLNYNTIMSLIYTKPSRVEFSKEPIERICPVCGKEFLTRNRRRKYCSKKCKDKKYLLKKKN